VKRITDEVPITNDLVVCTHDTKVFTSFQGWCVKCGNQVPVCQTCGVACKQVTNHSFEYSCEHNKDIRIMRG